MGAGQKKEDVAWGGESVNPPTFPFVIRSYTEGVQRHPPNRVSLIKERREDI